MSAERDQTRRSVEQALFGNPWTIDRYTIRGELGVGGMGQVYLGRDPQLGRPVAIKMVRSATPGVTHARLLREAKALASLAHPNVVAVYEVGLHEGTPFMAMEYVAGRTLGEWLSELSPSPREIVKMFLAVGRGLAAAHACGIVHRDFKPSNVMVGEDGRPRVLDFGIAKAHYDQAPTEDEPDGPWSGREADEATAPRPGHLGTHGDLTGTHMVMGTPLYMSPEQRAGVPADPRSDQYSFCVALYEALHGVHPFAAPDYPTLVERARAGTIGDPPPGVRVPAAWRRVIVRGLAVDPDDRHPDMDSLLHALEAMTTRRRGAIAVSAVLVATSIAAVATWRSWSDDPCATADAETVALWDEPRRAQIEPRFLQTGRRYAADTWARVDAQVSAYTERLAQAEIRACEARHEAPTLREAQSLCLERRRRSLAAFIERLEQLDVVSLDNVSSAVEKALDEPGRCLDPEVLALRVPAPDPAIAPAVASLRNEITTVDQLQVLGHYAQSAEQGRRAVARARDLDYPPVLAEALLAAGSAAVANGEPTRGAQTLEESYLAARSTPHEEIVARASVRLIDAATQSEDAPRAEIWSRLARSDLTRTHASAREWAQWHEQEAIRLHYVGEYEPAREHLDEAIAMLDASPSVERLALVQVHTNLSIVLSSMARYQEALDHLQRARELAEVALAEGHPHLAKIHDSISVVYSDLYRFEEAHAEAVRALEIRRAALDASHPDLAESQHNVAHTLYWLRRLDEARTHAQEAIAISERNRSGPLEIAAHRHLLAQILRDAGGPEEAIPQFQRTIEDMRGVLGPDHPRIVTVYNNLGLAQAQAGRSEEAIATYRIALAIGERTLEPTHLTLAVAHDNIAETLYEIGRSEEAMAEHRIALQLREANPDCPEALLATSYVNLGTALHGAGRIEEAIVLLRKAIEVGRRLPPEPEHQVRLGATLVNLGVLLSRSLPPRGEPTTEASKAVAEEAARLLGEAVQVLEGLQPPEESRLAAALTGLGEHHLRTGDAAAARVVLERAVTIPRPLGHDKGHVAKTQLFLAQALEESTGEHERAIALARSARDAWVELGDWPDYLARANAWLDEHEASPGRRR